MFKKFLTVLLVVVTVGGFALYYGCAPKGTPAPTPKTEELPPAQSFAVNDPYAEIIYNSEWVKFLYNGITERTQGRMKFDIYWAGGLGYKPAEGLRVVSQGVVPFGESFVEQYAAELPEFAQGALPMLFSNPREFEKFRVKFEDRLEKVLLEKYNVVLVVSMPQMGQSIITTKPVKTVEDFKGMKIRMIVEHGALWLKTLGAIAVDVPIGDLYTSLQRKVVDGAAIYPLALYDYKFGEVCKYQPIYHYCTGWWIFYCNKDMYNALPPLFKQAIKDMRQPTWEYAMKRMDTGYPETIKAIKDMGVDFTELPPSEMEKARAAAKPIWEEYCAKKGPTAVEGLKIAKEVLGR